MGIAFTPALDRTRLVEVSGTIWLDQSPLSLRSLEFRYENVNTTQHKAGIGGTFSFRTMDNGVVVIDEWQLRILSGVMQSVTTVQVGDIFGADPLAAGSGTEGTARVPVVQVEGGSILAALWADGASLTRPLAVVEGTIHEKGTGHPVAGIDVRLPNTPYHAISGDDGVFRIAGVFPGLYALSAVDSGWAPFDLGRPVSSQVRAQDDRVTPLKLEVDNRAKLTQDRCDLMASAVGPSMLAGRVVDAAGNPTRASVVWISDGSVPGLIRHDKFGKVIPPETTTQKTAGGLFWACGFSPGPVLFTATDDAGHQGTATAILASTVVTQLTITIPR